MLDDGLSTIVADGLCGIMDQVGLYATVHAANVGMTGYAADSTQTP